jgi:hypothetical protein
MMYPGVDHAAAFPIEALAHTGEPSRIPRERVGRLAVRYPNTSSNTLRKFRPRMSCTSSSE